MKGFFVFAASSGLILGPAHPLAQWILGASPWEYGGQSVKLTTSIWC
jgi:hypothetical protein